MALIDIPDLWEYQFVANDLPADPAAVVVPVADWLGPAPAPFGTIGASFTTNLEVGTAWALNSGLWVRRGLVVDGTASVRLRGQIENSCFVYLDGVYVGTFNPTNDQQVNLTGLINLDVIIPKALLDLGTHELAILCLDEAGGVGDTTFFWVTADYSPAILPLWPRRPMAENIAWLTHVMISENAEEEREQMRLSPRHEYQIDAFVPRSEHQRTVNTLYGNRSRQWFVPVWSQAQNIGAIAAGSTSLAAETRYSEFRDSSLLLIWQSPSHYQVAGIDRVSGDASIALSTLTEEFTDAWVMPCRLGYLDSDPSRAFNGRANSVEATFVIEDNAQLEVAAPEQYLGEDIYFEPGLLDGERLAEQIRARIDLVDEDLGPVVYSSPWTHPRPARVFRMMAEGPEEAWALREWLHRRAGRLRAFWQPSFEVDLRVLSTGALTTTLSIASDAFMRFAGSRTHIAIETATGWLPREITMIVQASEEEVLLTLDSSLAIDAADIKRACFLGLKRLDADRVEINWIGGPVCTAAVPTVEIEP